VVRRIARALRPHSVWVTAAPEPALVRVANIQHLGTPIRAQLAAPLSAVELAGVLHPTPAVGGEPLEVVSRLIPALEGLDRGWYAGAVGWSDGAGDGECCVARCCGAGWLLCMREGASCATPSRPLSSPRRRSSWARSCRCCPGEATDPSAGGREIRQ